MTKLAWTVLGLGILGWLIWFAVMDSVQRDISFERWLKERLTITGGFTYDD